MLRSSFLPRRSLLLEIALLVLLMAAAPVLPQGGAARYGGDEVGPAVVPFVFDGDLRDLPTWRGWHAGDPIREIPRRRGPFGGADASQRPLARLDPLLAVQERGSRGPTPPIAPILDFPGSGFTGVTPPDPVGDVGPGVYIQAVNTLAGSAFTIYDKSDGSVLAGPTTIDSLAAPGSSCADGEGDPIVLYDELADRWLISEFYGAPFAPGKLCVYVSLTADPVSGGWAQYEFQPPDFPDYPKYAVWPEAYFVTGNETAAVENLPAVYVLDRQNMVRGLVAAPMQRFEAPPLNGFVFQSLTPADLDGRAPPPGAAGILARHVDDEAHRVAPDGAQDLLELWEITVDFLDPQNSVLSGPIEIPVTEFDSSMCGLTNFSCFTQPAGGPALDPLREVIMWRLQYRNERAYESLVGNFVTDVDGTNRGGVRWFELRKAGGVWALHQEGTWSPDTVDRWMGSLALDRSGNLALGYNVVSNNPVVYPGQRLVGRVAGDSPGVLSTGEIPLRTGTADNSSSRYGDYSSMSVDPADGCTFWFTAEYNPSSQWTTHVGAFRFSACVPLVFADGVETGDLAAWSLVVGGSP